MTKEISISVKEVTKKYHLFRSPQERLKEALHPFRKRYHQEFWALKGVTFDVRNGRTVGILGRNGSGKSTLLQIISSVLHPTSGVVTVRGRVSALLELGAGFNPEFTGRENVIQNGAIMGISHKEMIKRMTTIEEFADVGEFFDQPMKIYSSGMFVRVAFATAINVDPDILLIDEALAVGDAKFQHKCFDRISEFQRRGKTIIFVSHNVGLVSNHCDRVILLEEGRIVADGEPHKVVDLYMDLLFGSEKAQLPNHSKENHSSDLLAANLDRGLFGNHLSQDTANDMFSTRRGYNPNETRIGDRSCEIIDYLIHVDGESETSAILAGSHVKLMIRACFHRSLTRPIIGFAIKTTDGIEIYGTNTYMLRVNVKGATAGELRTFQFSFRMPLIHGDYFFDLGLAEIDGTHTGSVIDVRRSVIHVAVVSDQVTFNGLVDLAPSFIDLAHAVSGNTGKTALEGK